VKEPSAPSVTYAGFWRRAMASLIDSTILVVLFSLLLGPAYLKAEFFSPQWIASTTITIAITVVLWIRYQGTPGKLLLGCQVVDAISLQPLQTRQAFLRYIGYYVSMLPLLLGFIWVGIDKRKQGFHDKIAKTFVLHNARLDTDDESQKSLQKLLSELR